MGAIQRVLSQPTVLHSSFILPTSSFPLSPLIDLLQGHNQQPGQDDEAGEAFGLLEGAVEPFEAGGLHPFGGALDAAGDDVEGAADADGDGDI